MKVDINKICISPDKTIRDVLILINENGEGAAFVVDSNNKYLGIITDGDIRRAILSGFDENTYIREIYNSNSIYLPVKSNIKKIQEKISSSIRIIPLLNDKREVVDFSTIDSIRTIPIMEPYMGQKELDYVTDCIRTNWISSKGKYVSKFEKQFEEMHHNYHALAVSNGTVALHLALVSLGIGPGDEVIVPDLTFAATINSVIYTGASPVICEIDSSLCIDPEEIKKIISPKTKAIIPVHLYGQVCDMKQILELSKEYKLLIIEDCAEAIGSKNDNKRVGTFGDASTFSFFGNKTISTGEGGMVIYKDKKIYEYAKRLRDHGMSLKKRYWHDDVGFNYRMTNLQAAVGVAQLERFDFIIDKKREIARKYNYFFKDYVEILKLPYDKPNSFNSYWLYTIMIDSSANRNKLIKDLLMDGIEVRPVFYPLHQMMPYKDCRRSKKLKNSTSASSIGLSLPSSLNITDKSIEKVAKGIIKQL